MRTLPGYPLGHPMSVFDRGAASGSYAGNSLANPDSNRAHAIGIASCPGMAFHVFGLLAFHSHRKTFQNGKNLSEFPTSAVGRARENVKEANVMLDRAGMSREQAMDLANQVRAERTKLRHQLHARTVHIVDVFVAPPWFVGNMRVCELLERCPSPPPREQRSLAPTTTSRQVRKWLTPLNLRAARANVNLFCEIDDLTPRARAWLVAELRRMYRLPMTGGDWAVLERQVPFPVQEVPA